MRSAALWVMMMMVVMLSMLTMEVDGRRRRARQDQGHVGRIQRDRFRDFMTRFGLGSREYERFGQPYHYNRPKDWWEGPHVCRSEEDSGDPELDASTIAHHHQATFHVCEESRLAIRCKTTVHTTEQQLIKTVLHHCCHGYSRQYGDFGCPQQLEMKSLTSEARDLGLHDFLKAMDTVRLTQHLAQGNFTVFAPIDGAFPLHVGPGLTVREDGGLVRVSEFERDRVEGDLRAVMLGHLVTPPRRASSFSDEEILTTSSPYDSTVRINFYSRPEKLTTANCVKVTSSDNMAANGVIHTVETVLPSVVSSLLDIIQRDDSFSILKTALARANLVSELKGEGQYTLLAPTNAAFQALDPRLLGRFLHGDPKCLAKVLKQHLLPHVICSTVIHGHAKSRNVLRNYVNLTRTEDGKIFVDYAQVVRADVMATNGVMHVIDAVLVPDDALDLVSVIKRQGLNDAVKLLDWVKLTSTLTTAHNLTLFCPSNHAAHLQALSSALKKQTLPESDVATVRGLMTYHIVTEDLTSHQLYNNRLLHTLSDGHKIRINKYSPFPFGGHTVMTAQCVPVISHDVTACNSVVHVTDQMLVPPEGNVVDILALDSNYSSLVRLLKKAGLADALQEDGLFTVFAPSNQAFQHLGKKRLRELEESPEELTNLLQLHIHKDNLCCAGILSAPWWHRQRVRALNGQLLSLMRDRRGRPIVNDVLIGQCDKMATNGVVHGITTVLDPDPLHYWY